MSGDPTTLTIPLEALRARLRRLLQRAGYTVSVELKLQREDGDAMTEWDVRGLPTLVTAWQRDQEKKRAGERSESALDAIDRAVSTKGPLLLPDTQVPSHTARPAQRRVRPARGSAR